MADPMFIFDSKNMEYEVYSHHPPITAYVLEDVDGDYKFWGASEFTDRLGTNSMKAG